jgi:hypothetical protein
MIAGLNLPGLLSEPAANAAERDPDEEPELCLHTQTFSLAPPAQRQSLPGKPEREYLECALCRGGVRNAE